MASKKDKFKKAASDQLKRSSGSGESGGMSELVRNIEEDKKEEIQASKSEPPKPEVKPEAKKEPETKQTTEAAPESVKSPETAPEESSKKPSEKSPEKPAEEPPAADFPSEGDVFETAMVVEVDSGAGNISLPEKEPPAESGPQDQDPPPRRGERMASAPSEKAASKPETEAPVYSTRRAETIGMAKTRESIYNVSSDIRLEDYTESQSEGGGFGGIAKIGAGLLILLLLAWGVQSLVGLFFAPEYVLAVSSSPITDAGLAQAAQATTVSPGHGGSVFVRFQWNEGELKTDLVRITAEKSVGGSWREVASKSRTLPETVTYIYFQNSFTPGRYRIQVTGRDGDMLAEREIFIR